MSIKVYKDCEYSTLIADFIEKLAKEEKFSLKIWINGSELPLVFDESCEFFFLQEGFRFNFSNIIGWVFYDTIVYMRLKHENK